MIPWDELLLIAFPDELLSMIPWDELLLIAFSEELLSTVPSEELLSMIPWDELFPFSASLLEEFAKMLEEESPREADVELLLSEQPIIPKIVTLRQRAPAPINERLYTFIDPSLNHCLITFPKHKIKDLKLSIQKIEMRGKSNGMLYLAPPIFSCMYILLSFWYCFPQFFR